MKDKINKILIIAIIIILSITFCTYAPVVTYDSSHYLWLTSLLTPADTVQNWDVARGIVFPGIIRVSTAVLGQNAEGIVATMFIFYVAMITAVYLILKKVNKLIKIFEGKIKTWVLVILLLILIALNPIIFGYYHTILTECIAITFAVIGCFASWKWMDIEFDKNKTKAIIYTLFLAFMTAVSWHLKQPYVSTILFPTLVATIISIIQNFKLKNVLFRIGTVVICLISLISSIFIWNKVLSLCNVTIKEERTSQSFITGGIFSGLSQLYEVQDEAKEKAKKEKDKEKDEEKITIKSLEKYKLSEEDKKEIINIVNGNSSYKNYKIFTNKDANKEDLVLFTKDVEPSKEETIKFLDNFTLTEKNKEKIIQIINGNSKYKGYKIYTNKNENKDDSVLFTKGEDCGTGEAINFLLKTLFTKPNTVIKSYTTGYLGIIDVLQVEVRGNRVVPKNTINWVDAYENQAIAYRIYSDKLTNVFPLDEEYERYAAPYVDLNQSIKISNNIICMLKMPILQTTKICFLILPIVLLAQIIISIVKRKKYTMENKKISNLIIILLSFSFLHIMLHTVLGAIIDRYTVPAMIPMFLAYIIIIFRIIKKEKKAI